MSADADRPINHAQQKALRDLAAFEEAGARLGAMGRSNLHDAVHQVLAELQDMRRELQQLREAVQPSESPLLIGADALREYRALTTHFTTARKEH